MPARALICIAAFFVGVLGSDPAHAVLISGSYSGTAAASSYNVMEDTVTTVYAPVTGRFSLEAALPEPGSCCADCCGPWEEPGSLRYEGMHIFNFSVVGADYAIDSNDYDNGYDSITLMQDQAAQSVTARGGGPYWYWALSLVNSDGGLFQGFDPATFDPAHVDMSQSSAMFSGDIRSYGAVISFDSLRFDGYVQEVPEPAPLGLLGLGLLMLPLVRRRGRY